MAHAWSMGTFAQRAPHVSGAASTAAPTRHRAVHLALAGCIMAVSVITNASAPLLVVLLFVVVVPFEKLFPRHRNQRVRRTGLGTDLAFALATPLISAVGLIVALFAGLASMAWLPGLALRPVVHVLPAPLLLIVGTLLFDLVGYWSHRLAHENAKLWRFHSIHHTGEHLDWLSGVRMHPLDGILLGPPVVFLVAAGFPAKATGAIAAAQLIVGLFLHANVRWRLRLLHRVVATPDFHHWHHANEPAAIHTNYAAFLPIWDQVFGTYRIPQHRQPLRYGIDHGIGEPHPSTFVGLLVAPFAGIATSRSNRRAAKRTDNSLA